MPTRSVENLMQGHTEREPAFAAKLLHEGSTNLDSVTEAILETADGMHRTGIMDAETYTRITTQHGSLRGEPRPPRRG